MKTKIIINEIEPKYFVDTLKYILSLPVKGVKLEKIEFPQSLSNENFEVSEELKIKAKMENVTWEDISNSLKDNISIMITSQNRIKVNDLEYIRKLCDYEIEERIEENKIIFWPKDREIL
ncbi:MAG: hypothetical protein HPY60_06415 [Candidatus Methanofastidiosum sp.]|nr:hypothetical protein [Methanofastidiosum sp.]